MKKVLFFIESLSGGGAEKVLTDLVSNLDANKYQITVCCLINVGVYNDQLKNICTYKSILPNVASASMLQKLLYRVKYYLFRKLPPKWVYHYFFKEKYDVEIAFIEGYATKIIGNSSNSKSKKIAWVHIDLEANHWTKTEYKNIEQEIKSYKKFNHIVSVAESVKNAFSRKFGIQKNLLVKYNPVDKEDIIFKAKEPLHVVKSKNSTRLVTVGRLEPQKGYDRLLQVINRLIKDKLLVELWIVGEGSKRPELQEYIKEHNLQDYITLQGFQKNPYKYIAASDVFVCSSRSEGYSTVVTEALILGKPVIATNCSGMIELLGDNEYGIITQNNTEALYLGLKRFLEDKKTRQHYRSKSKERSADFDIKKTIKKIEELL